MRKLFLRTINAINVGLYCLKNPEFLNINRIEMIWSLYKIIFTVQSERNHLITKIATIHPGDKSHNICTLWCGSGVDSSPIDRIIELIKENIVLSEELEKLKNNKVENKWIIQKNWHMIF